MNHIKLLGIFFRVTWAICPSTCPTLIEWPNDLMSPREMVDKLEHYLFLMRDRLSRVWCFQSVWGSRPGRREDKPTFGRSLICLTHFLTFGKYYWRRHEKKTKSIKGDKTCDENKLMGTYLPLGTEKKNISWWPLLLSHILFIC